MMTMLRNSLARLCGRLSYRLEDWADRLWVPMQMATLEEMEEMLREEARVNGQIAKALAEHNPWLDLINGGEFKYDDKPKQ